MLDATSVLRYLLLLSAQYSRNAGEYANETARRLLTKANDEAVDMDR